MATNELVERWLAAIKPFSLEETKGKYIESFGKRTDLPEDMKKDLIKAIDSIDLGEVNDRLKAYAQEHFSDHALAAAVALFESTVGQKYLKERDVVMGYFQIMFGTVMGDAINRTMGGGSCGGR